MKKQDMILFQFLMLSYTSGLEVPLLSRTTGEQLAKAASLWPDRTALISRHQNVRLTWSELLDMADRVGNALRSSGLSPGDRVGVWAMNCFEWVVVHLACARAGLVLVSVNPAYRTHDLSFVLKKSRMKVLFLRERDERGNYAEILEEARGTAAAPLERAILFGSEAWNHLLDAAPRIDATCSPEDVTNIQYTSGTTGSPKGALLTHRNLVNNGMLIAGVLRYTEGDRICVPVPMSHCFGNVIGTMASLSSGACMILPNSFFDARATLDAIEAESATSIYGVPTMFIAELRHPEFSRFNLTSLRTGVMAGAPCPMEIMKQVVSDMHCPELIIAYGLTETAPVLTMSAVDDDLQRRVSTVGKALPCTELRVVSVTTGGVAEVGVQGEIQARGYMVMKGYDDDAESTARAIDSEGWFRTGDLGVMQEDGYFRITGRAKDMIIRGGENIYPREIEEFLYTHPKVAEVQVTGLPDERFGEVVLAWVRVKPGLSATVDEIRDFCRNRIAHFKIPHYVRFVDSFPTTVSGKIQKFRIREIEMELRREDAACEAAAGRGPAPQR
jgi:fatty-acyl-CoA synthase